MPAPYEVIFRSGLSEGGVLIYYMQSETKNCQNCKKDFIIESDDFSFYEKIKVPPPTFCFECRQQRRYSWRNERTLYRRDCDLCGKSSVTIYHPKSPYKVYCPPCWWGDGWNGKDFAQDFDFSLPFFEQWHELQLKVPRISLLTKNSINSEYTHHSGGNKNCYLSFATFDSEDVMYSTRVVKSKQICDSMFFLTGACELLYECINASKCYNSQYCFLIKDCVDCFYGFDLHNCSNCFMCNNLRSKKYCIRNVQYSKDEYIENIKNINFSSYKTRSELYEEYLNMIEKKATHKSAVIEQSVECSGNFIFQSRNTHFAFNVEDNENVKYAIDSSIGVRNNMDVYNTGLKCELCYETHGMIGSSNVFFTHMSYDNSFVQYCDLVNNCSNLFGCIGLKKNNYCILNKQYEKEEYNKLKDKIIEHMKKTGEYGEFFPSSISPIYYNESQGQVYMPLSKEEALSKGFRWQDDILITKDKETILSKNIPDSILDIQETIISEVLKCISCERNYNIVSQELQFYRKLNIPIPRKCSNCRYLERIKLRGPRKLWHRKCMNEGCENTFETTYAPERPEIIYCESCYQKEVY